MAIAYDNSTANSQESTTMTFSHTVNSNSNGILFVWIDHEGTSGSVNGGVTYGGVSMTAVTGMNPGTTANTRRTYAFYLLAPATGANNVVINNNFPGGDDIDAVAVSYTGVNQSGTFDASGTYDSAGGNVTTITKSLTTVANNCWLVGMAAGSGKSFVVGANTTLRANVSTAADECAGCDTNAAQTPAGSHALTITQSSGAAQMLVISIAPAAIVGPTNLKTYNTNPLANIKTIDTNLIANVKTFDTNA